MQFRLRARVAVAILVLHRKGKDMSVTGKLEVTVKISQVPTEVTVDKNGWSRFVIDCAGRSVHIALRPRMWNKIKEASTQWPSWLATISGVMGPSQGQGFILVEPAVQVFERKPKQENPPPETSPSA